MNFENLFPVKEWLSVFNLSNSQEIWLRMLILVAIATILAIIADYLTKKILLNTLSRIIKKSKTKWDDILLEKRVFNRLAHLAPAFVIYVFAEVMFSDFHDIIAQVLMSLIEVYIIILIVQAINSLLNGAKEIYDSLPISRNRPITGYIQLIKILLYFIAGIIILSVVLNIKIMVFITGLGAVAAILLLIFKDTILGFVASIQLSENDMVKPGDWISMPKFEADGTVLEVTLNTVKVQNWNKTISTIPTYALVSESFQNWKGMEKSGGRRIKRSLLIDMKSIKFCDEKMLNKLEQIKLLSDYIKDKRKVIDNAESLDNNPEIIKANKRLLTNIGTFRKYIEYYLHNNPKIHEDMTFLVRQLQPTEKGLPIEIYVFSTDQDWVKYEAVQSDIFDHLLAIISEFDLRIFQNPSGYDFNKAFRQ